MRTEDAFFEGCDEEAAELWARKRTLSLPKQLREQIQMQSSEPLRRSDKIFAQMSKVHGTDAASSSSAAASQSLLANEDTAVWKKRVRYSRAQTGHERIRLSRDIYDLWHPFQMKPSPMELCRPWMFKFSFVEEKEGHCTKLLRMDYFGHVVGRSLVDPNKRNSARQGGVTICTLRWKL